jgi:hypothetical protein
VTPGYLLVSERLGPFGEKSSHGDTSHAPGSPRVRSRVNPPLALGGVPDGAHSLVLVMGGPVAPGGNDYGYVGPDPPNKQWYRFKLYAVAEPVGLSRGASKRALGEAMDGTRTSRSRSPDASSTRGCGDTSSDGGFPSGTRNTPSENLWGYRPNCG